jgi:hypothetical protein
MPTLTPVDFDPFEGGGKSGPTLTPVDFDPFATPVGKQLSPTQQMLGGMENLLPAAEQGTNPNPEAYQRYLGPATVGEEGEVFYKDEKGVPRPTDQSKHVVIRDPKDGQVKVFERSADTEEGGLVGASRVLAPGLATGPLARTPGAARAAAGPASREAIVEAATRQGIEVPNAIASENLLTQQAGAQLRNVPVLGTPIIRNTERTIRQLGEGVEGVAKGQGGASMEGAGDLAASRIQDWIGPRTTEALDEAYGAAGRAIDPNIRAPLTETQSLLDELAATRRNAGLPESNANLNLIRRAIQGGEPADDTFAQLVERLGPEGAQKTAQRMGIEMTPQATGLNYPGTKDLRTYVRNLQGGAREQVTPGDLSATELKRLEGTLGTDLRSIVERAGNTTGSALFERANTLAAKVAEDRKALADIVGVRGDASPAQVFDRLKAAAGSKSRADIELLLRAKNAVGDDWDEVTSAITARLGKNNKGEFSPELFLRDWDQMSDAGKAAIYGKGHRQTLDDIATISKRWPKLQKFQNPSGTAQNVMGGALGAGVVLHPMAALAALLEPSTAAGVGGAALLARYLAKPATAASSAAWMRAYERAATSRTPAAIAQLERMTRNLMNTVDEKQK